MQKLQEEQYTTHKQQMKELQDKYEIVHSEVSTLKQSNQELSHQVQDKDLNLKELNEKLETLQKTSTNLEADLKNKVGSYKFMLN